MMRGVWSSVAELAVVQAQDLLGIGSEGRMNTPSSVGKNWRWRALPGSFTPQLAARMRANMGLFRRLLKDSGYPGMKILQFAFDRREADSVNYMPHNFPVHCVAYTGTHDNDTVLGWMENADPIDVANSKGYLGLHAEEG